jgi:HlyD family secretion protein
MKGLIVFLVVCALIGAAGWRYSRPVPIEVRLHTVDLGEVRATVSNTRVGTVKACERAQMSASAPGQVAAINVIEGSRVSPGDVLLEIWNNDRRAELRLAEAEASAARARSKEVCAIAAGAEREADRLKQLQKRKLISEESVDKATTDAQSRRAGCEAGLAATRVSAAQIGVAREALERTLLRAPFSGVVAEIDVRLGEYLTPSPPGIATLPAIDLINPSCVYVAAPIDEVDAPDIVQGMSVCVSLDAFPDQRCDATVRRIAPYVLDLEKQARTVEVDVEFTDKKHAAGLLPGYSADIEILIEARQDVIRIPSEALIEGKSVWIVDSNTSTVEQRDVQVGIANWEFSEILTGLAAGEIIVLSTGRSGVDAGALVVGE